MCLGFAITTIILDTVNNVSFTIIIIQTVIKKCIGIPRCMSYGVTGWGWMRCLADKYSYIEKKVFTLGNSLIIIKDNKNLERILTEGWLKNLKSVT